MIDKRGSIFGLFSIIVVIFALVVVVYVGKTIFSEFANASPIQADATASAMAEKTTSNLYPAFGNMTFIVLIGMLIFFAVMGFQLHQHPAFFPISAFVVLPIGVLVASIISNVHEKLVENATIAVAADSVIINNIFANLPFYIFGFGIILLTVIYGFSRSGGEI
jgi:hypothetical protein|tara:strand:- start:376 stop:867 length:492 start_codon:yes stop_codon:yes gene_type:complete